MDLQTGSIVKSNSGRDGGSYYIVMSLGEGVCYIADGKRRKTDKPKKKNVRHVETVGLAAEIANRIKQGMKVGNATVKKALRTFNQK